MGYELAARTTRGRDGWPIAKASPAAALLLDTAIDEMVEAPQEAEKHLLRAMLLSPDCVMIHVTRAHLHVWRDPEVARVTAMLFSPLARDLRTRSHLKILSAQCPGADLPDALDAHLISWPGDALALALCAGRGQSTVNWVPA